MSFRSSYSANPQLGDEVFELLEVPFPGVSAGRRNGEAFGVPWEACSTPFVARDRGRVICHVGLLELPLRVMGRNVVVGGVHGVATHPDHRRRGVFRAVIGELLQFAADRYPTLALTTLHPEYFEPFGFRVVPEFVHRSALIRPATMPDARTLDLADPSDLAILHRLVERRTPISDYLGVGAEKGCFGFVEFRSTIRFSERLDAAVIAERDHDLVRVYDVIGHRTPGLDEILGLVVGEPGRLLCFFAPDRLAGTFTAEPHDQSGGPDALEPGTRDWVLMVRGPFAAEGHPIMLPRPARC